LTPLEPNLVISLHLPSAPAPLPVQRRPCRQRDLRRPAAGYVKRPSPGAPRPDQGRTARSP